MKWWWSGKDGVSMAEDDFFEMIEYSLCADFVEYLEIVEGKGFYIPFITTMNYLTHPSSKKSLGIQDYSNLSN
jgi:hypothetical protein